MDPDYVVQIKYTIVLAQYRFEGIFGYLEYLLASAFYFLSSKHPIWEVVSVEKPLQSGQTYHCQKKVKVCKQYIDHISLEKYKQLSSLE